MNVVDVDKLFVLLFNRFDDDCVLLTESADNGILILTLVVAGDEELVHVEVLILAVRDVSIVYSKLTAVADAGKLVKSV